jgi:hypothetical protein
MVLALGLASCGTPPETAQGDAVANAVTDSVTDYLGTQPPRTVSESGEVSEVCVDELNDLWTSIGVDLDAVSLADEGEYIVASIEISSIHALIDTRAVPLDSLLQANDATSFTFDFESIPSDSDPGSYVSVTAYLTSESMWTLKGWKTPGGDFGIQGGDFAVDEGKTVVVRIPAGVVPEGDLEWSLMVKYNFSDKDFCPGGVKESGESLLWQRN